MCCHPQTANSRLIRPDTPPVGYLHTITIRWGVHSLRRFCIAKPPKHVTLLRQDTPMYPRELYLRHINKATGQSAPLLSKGSAVGRLVRCGGLLIAAGLLISRRITRFTTPNVAAPQFTTQTHSSSGKTKKTSRKISLPGPDSSKISQCQPLLAFG